MLDININNYIYLLIHILVIASAFVYLIFALIIIKQVKNFSKNIKDKYDAFIQIASVIHLIFTVFFVLATFFLL